MSTSEEVPVIHWKLGEEGDDTPPDSLLRTDSTETDQIASEVPVAMTYNRHPHVVMMATPDDFEDFGLGFSLTEGLIGEPEDLVSMKAIPRDGGIELAMSIKEQWYDRLQTQRRNLTGRTGCGLCGAERIEQALRYPEPVGNNVRVNHQVMQRAVSDMTAHQPLQSITGATHAAAWCDLAGEITDLREDVGRHNALDKLIGALARKKFDPQGGFVLVSSRASYEMVYKAAAVGMELIMAVSAPTTLAVDFAQRSGMTLAGFARPGRHNVYTFPGRIKQ
ncbi:MAG TPA: formate dehydrogenase accessory sulfurtransferase FdhD [Xanthomonadales bacterium]|nr:formate dehydrogenase accessory sulfurtransferase FdhD [Xanthomonadales bacterium]